MFCKGEYVQCVRSMACAVARMHACRINNRTLGAGGKGLVIVRFVQYTQQWRQGPPPATPRPFLTPPPVFQVCTCEGVYRLKAWLLLRLACMHAHDYLNAEGG